MLRSGLLLIALFANPPTFTPQTITSAPIPARTCTDVSQADPTDDGAIPPTPSLPQKKKVSVQIQFVQQYGEGDDAETTDAWTAIEMQYVCAAARRFQAVWSSRDFYDRLTALPSLYLDHGQRISGSDLYEKLTARPIVLRLSIGGDENEYGISWPQGWTKVPHGYLDRHGSDGSDTGRGVSLIEDLTDTISHEYTHYSSSVESGDGHVRDDPRYVSYGIGCLTENMAVTGDTCWFDPSRPTLWRRSWKLPKP